MARIQRNDRCPCGSGKKYKQCCLEKDQAAERAERAAHQPPPSAATRAERLDSLFFKDGEDDQLTIDSNAVVDMVHAGELDQAEAAARELLVRYPDVHDGYDRLGMVYEARGEPKIAADCYRKVIAFIHEHQHDYDPGFEDVFIRLVNRLDPSDPA